MTTLIWVAGDIDALLAGTELAARFAPVANATRELRPKEALAELKGFRQTLRAPEQKQ